MLVANQEPQYNHRQIRGSSSCPSIARHVSHAASMVSGALNEARARNLVDTLEYGL